MDLSKKCLAFALAANSTACAAGMGQVRDAIAAAPEWYQDRAVEVRGEGYPSIGRIPTLDAGERSASGLESGRDGVLVADELFRLDPRSVPPGLELDAMLEWAGPAKAEANQRAGEPGNHLTDADAEALRALFVNPRATS
ncbi:MAG: hypothetical protein AAF829_05500 [Pseudomonadota bacterium]